MIIRKDKYYVPKKYVQKSKLFNMQLELFDHRMCRVCPLLEERISDACFDCRGFGGKFIFWDKVKINGKTHYSFLPGNLEKIKKVVPEFDRQKIVDKRISIPLKSKLKYILAEKTQYMFQSEAIDKLSKFDEGLFVSPPRSGKTGMIARLICKKKQRTLIIAHQSDLLNQFISTFYGNKKDKVPKFTNAARLEAQLGYSVVKIAKKHQDFFDTNNDVVLTNYQLFLHHPKLLKKVSRVFGMVIVDEVHRQASDCYSKIMSSFCCKYRYGFTGTAVRKDQRSKITDFITGPIRHKVKINVLVPTISVQRSKQSRKITANWVTMLKQLHANGPRNEDIIKHIIKDLKNGASIVIPCVHRNYIDVMVEEINKAWMDESETMDQIASAFYSGKQTWKDDVLEKARSGEIRCVIAMRGMLLGINVPRWSHLYAISPINNPPNFEQESKRICTPFKNKKPVIRFFVDTKCSMATTCSLNTLKTCKTLKYYIPKDVQKIIKSITIQHNTKNNQTLETSIIGKVGKQIEL